MWIRTANTAGTGNTVARAGAGEMRDSRTHATPATERSASYGRGNRLPCGVERSGHNAGKEGKIVNLWPGPVFPFSFDHPHAPDLSIFR